MRYPRVLHVLCDLSGGGAERLVLELAGRTGGEVAVVQEGGVLAAEFARAGVPVHRLLRQRRRPGGRALLRLIRLARRFDVVHTHLWAGHAWGAPAARVAGRALVCHEHNVERDEPPWKQRVREFWLARADAVVAVSAAVAAASGVGAVVVPNGIDLDRFRRPWVGGEGILAVGRLVPQKGMDILVSASRDLGVRVVIAGDGPERARLAPAAPHVEWLGFSPDVSAHLARADVVAIPSRWEGFGLAALEAMAAGAPVVASRVDGLAELVGDAGLLVPPEEPALLAAALARVLHHRDLQRTMSEAGRARAAGFGIDRCVDRVAAVWRSVHEQPPSDRVQGIHRD